jgi:hypothetical protein
MANVTNYQQSLVNATRACSQDVLRFGLVRMLTRCILHVNDQTICNAYNVLHLPLLIKICKSGSNNDEPHEL